MFQDVELFSVNSELKILLDTLLRTGIAPLARCIKLFKGIYENDEKHIYHLFFNMLIMNNILF